MLGTKFLSFSAEFRHFPFLLGPNPFRHQTKHQGNPRKEQAGTPGVPGPLRTCSYVEASTEQQLFVVHASTSNQQILELDSNSSGSNGSPFPKQRGGHGSFRRPSSIHRPRHYIPRQRIRPPSSSSHLLSGAPVD